MEKHYVDIDGYWGVLLVYGFDKYDQDELESIMTNFGANECEIDEAMDVLYGINGGMTISKDDVTMSAIFIGEADSQEQFYDTFVHEIDHVQDAILHHYGVPQGSEDAAWLQGYIMRLSSRWLIQDGYICRINDF